MDNPAPQKRSEAASPPSGPPLSPLPPPRPRRRLRWSYLIAALAILILAGGVVIYYRQFIAPYEDTDDAFIDGYVTFVAPQVDGPVVSLLVNDNQRVKAGDVLIEIDPRDFETRVAQSRADLAAAEARRQQAKAQVAVDQAKAGSTKSSAGRRRGHRRPRRGGPRPL